ncbi:unnamed protein product [Nesidiocoris tenuis]|uniref:Uncharacterized protein n=1 Tax=Nesidiocoris tenuis TaxID=355587 RepID=A0A6H5GGZ9_9HEMI|nr:unnamed protein product [Nesidiocoris tenuis]
MTSSQEPAGKSFGPPARVNSRKIRDIDITQGEDRLPIIDDRWKEGHPRYVGMDSKSRRVVLFFDSSNVSRGRGQFYRRCPPQALRESCRREKVEDANKSKGGLAIRSTLSTGPWREGVNDRCGGAQGPRTPPVGPQVVWSRRTPGLVPERLSAYSRLQPRPRPESKSERLLYKSSPFNGLETRGSIFSLRVLAMRERAMREETGSCRRGWGVSNGTPHAATYLQQTEKKIILVLLLCREAEVCNHSHHETKPLRWAGRRYFALWRCICGLGHPIARGTILSDLMGSPLRPEWSRASGIAALPFTLMYIAEGRGSLKGWRATGARTRKERPPVPPHRAASHMTNGPYSYASREAGPRG